MTIDTVALAIGLAFLSGFLSGQIQSMLIGGDHYASALACFSAALMLAMARGPTDD